MAKVMAEATGDSAEKRAEPTDLPELNPEDAAKVTSMIKQALPSGVGIEGILQDGIPGAEDKGNERRQEAPGTTLPATRALQMTGSASAPTTPPSSSSGQSSASTSSSSASSSTSSSESSSDSSDESSDDSSGGLPDVGDFFQDLGDMAKIDRRQEDDQIPPSPSPALASTVKAVKQALPTGVKFEDVLPSGVEAEDVKGIKDIIGGGAGRQERRQEGGQASIPTITSVGLPEGLIPTGIPKDIADVASAVKDAITGEGGELDARDGDDSDDDSDDESDDEDEEIDDKIEGALPSQMADAVDDIGDDIEDTFGLEKRKGGGKGGGNHSGANGLAISGMAIIAAVGFSLAML